MANGESTGPDRSASTGRLLTVAAAVGGTYAVGSLVLQRYVAQTRGSAILLLAIWTVVIAAAAVVLARRAPRVRATALGTLTMAILATVAIGYWTGFRDTKVNEDIAVASAQAQGAERRAALAGSSSGSGVAPAAERDGAAKSDAAKPGSKSKSRDEGPSKGGRGEASSSGSGAASAAKRDAAAKSDAAKSGSGSKSRDEGPSKGGGGGAVSLAMGSFIGADGHAGAGKAEVVKTSSGGRALTFSRFDVDPGPDVNVYLSASADGVSDAKLIGDLKGSKGNQQYAIPTGLDLTRFSNVVLYCEPFSVRIAVAKLDA